MADRIFSNRPRGTMTSAIWNVMDRPCRTILAPIFTSLSRSVVIGQCSTSVGSLSRFLFGIALFNVLTLLSFYLSG